MRPIQFTLPAMPATDRDGIALAQTPAGAGALTLNGTLVSGGVATLVDPDPTRNVPAYGSTVTIYSGSNITNRTLTITGTIAGGATASETVTGPNNGTVDTTLVFETVTGVTISGAAAGDIEVGIEGGGTQWMPLDIMTPNQVTTISTTVDGTINYTWQYTNEDPFDTTIVQQAVDHPDADLVAETTSKTGDTTVLMRAVRFMVNSGTGTARNTVTRQSTA